MTAGSEGQLEVLIPVAARYGDGSYQLAPRLASLENKTIGLLWNAKPNGDVALRYVGDVIKTRYENVDIRFYSGSLKCATSLLEQAAKECDGVIACTADCGSCTSWITHDCVQLEKAGVPTVIIASAGFEHDVEASAKAFAMETMQYVVVPKVYNNITVEESVEQTKPVTDEVIKLLTSGSATSGVAADEESEAETFSGATSYDSYLQFNRTFLDRDWTDGYPVWPPTREQVAPFLDAVDGSADDVVCLLPPGNGVATVRTVAINAAMAGCAPAEMPVIMAALRAIANKKHETMIRVALMSTSAHAPLVLVNGPIGKELGINGGRACLGPGKQNEVNIRISRAVVFCLKNIGKWYPGIMDLDTVGSPRKNIVVFAENEDESPWEPYHVSHGFAAEDSTVTVFFTTGEMDISFQGHIDADQLAMAIASFSGGNSSIGYIAELFPEEVQLGRLLVVPPPHAIPLSEGGYTKRAFEKLLWQQGHEPVSRLLEPIRKMHQDGKIRKEYQWLFDLSPQEQRNMTMPVIERADQYSVVVAGSVRAKDLLMPIRTAPVTELATRKPSGAI